MYMCILHHITTKSQSLLIQILCKTHFRFFRKWYPKLCKIIKRLLCCLKGGFPHPVKSSFNEIIEVLVQSEIQFFFQRSAPLPNKFWHISSIAKLHLQLTILDVKICKCYFARIFFLYLISHHEVLLQINEISNLKLTIYFYFMGQITNCIILQNYSNKYNSNFYRHICYQWIYYLTNPIGLSHFSFRQSFGYILYLYCN